MSWSSALSCLVIGAVIGGVSADLVSSARGPDGCVRLDAGLRHHGHLYLFHGGQYVKIDGEDAEISMHNISEWRNMPANVDAAIQWSGNYEYYFFKDSDYYSYELGRARGPWPSGYWWDKFFDEGIDAAGNVNDVSYFFKGCTYRTWGSYTSGISGEKGIPMSLPCHIDAAWDLANDWENLVLVKDDQMWIWSRDDIQGPIDFNTRYQLKSWKLCAADPKAETKRQPEAETKSQPEAEKKGEPEPESGVCGGAPS